MNGTGVPLATPFDESGELDVDALAAVTEWVTERGIDFLVPCGSNSEAELLTADERARVIETVVDAAPDGVAVLAGTGHPGFKATVEQSERAAEAGADGVLVVTPFYYTHDESSLAAYYRDVADAVSAPVYLYSVPAYTNVKLDPRTVESLAEHENVVGMKDSSGDLETLQRERDYASEFELFTGSGSVFAPALDAGADGGIMALGNVVPERVKEIYELHRAGKDEEARQLNSRLVDLNRAVTSEYGVPGLKAAMRYRDAPAGHVRRPFRPLGADATKRVETLVDAALP